MLTFAHYRFKQFLKHKAFETGKLVLDVNEAYTSKTVSWTGEIVKNLGGAKVIRSRKDGQAMRDINGARGIFLRIRVVSKWCVGRKTGYAFGLRGGSKLSDDLRSGFRC